VELASPLLRSSISISNNGGGRSGIRYSCFGIEIIYAPNGTVTINGNATIHGGIIAKQITISGTLTVNGTDYPEMTLRGKTN
jgi:hypothetical protein